MAVDKSTIRPKIMVTGGMGYIGSHCVVELIKDGYDVVIVDNFQNSNREVFNRITKILNLDLNSSRIRAFDIDMLDLQALKVVFADSYPLDSVMHLAGLKSVGESVLYPMKYYKTNLISTINLIECMAEFKVNKLIFSSSATVYGKPKMLPITEAHPIGHNLTNTYGQTKFMIEQMLEDLMNSQTLATKSTHSSDNQQPLSITVLRYFNPVGADSSGLIGECPIGPPANLMPFVCQVASGVRACVYVYGNDYDTSDGTGVRDYIHVTDLALGHLAALKHMKGNSRYKIYNLGTGQGFSVLNMIEAMEKASSKKIPFEIKPRREGDIDSVYCDPSKALQELNWKAEKTLDDMCDDMWKWQTLNPEGYVNL